MTETVRTATTEDIEAITDLVNRAYRPVTGDRGWTHEAALVSGSRTTSDQIKDVIAQGTVILVLTDRHGIVGCVTVSTQGRASQIGMLSCAPERQASGVGSRLLLEAERHAEKHFEVESHVLQVLSQRTELIRFYERRGYQITEGLLPYPEGEGFGTPIVPNLMVLTMTKPITLNKSEARHYVD